LDSLTNKRNILSFICTLLALNVFAQSNLIALELVENKGQWDKKVNFKGDFGNGAFFLRKTGFTVLQHHPGDLSAIAERTHGKNPEAPLADIIQDKRKKGDKVKPQLPVDTSVQILRSHAYTMDFVGANPNPQMSTEKVQPGLNNYFIGDDPSLWASNCRIFQGVTYKNVYPGIDVKYYSESGSIKYEFIVHPGGDASKIAMRFDGVNKLSVKNNELIIHTSVGDVKELYPYTYQFDGTERKEIDAKYSVDGNVVRFNIKSYSRQATLVIDPTLIFASFSGSKADNWGYTATYGPDGSFFGGGIVFDNGFPTNTGAYQTKYSASSVSETFWNMGIIKFTPDGGQRIYATYIGGTNQDQPHSLFADPQGNLVIGGRTNSPKFPATNSNTYGPSKGWDIVVIKLNATGSGIIGAVRIAGSEDDGQNIGDSHNSGPRELIYNYGDDARSEVILDAGNNVYLTSCTRSPDFYTTPNAAQRTIGGLQDAVLIKLTPDCNTITYSSFFGGRGNDAGFVLALNPLDNDIYMAGGTTSDNLQGNKAGVVYPGFMGGTTDGYIAVFSNDGSVLKRTTYMGTAGIDLIFGIQFDRHGFPYIMGITTAQWPIVNAASKGLGPSNSKQFVSKLRKDLSGFEYSTVFGNGSGKPNISPVAFLVDRCENVYVSGWGKHIVKGFDLDAIIGMPTTPDALKSTPDESDFYFIVIERDARSLLYGTFYGQNGGLGEHVDGGTSRFDENGVIYQAICANCGSVQGDGKPRWPVTPGAWCCTTGYAPASGGGCNLAALKISFNFAGVGAGVRSYINSTFDTSGCVPLEITFRDTVRNAQSYEWNFGDGSPELFTDNFETKHVYNNIGVYHVRLVAIDSTSCNIRDTSYVTVRVRNDQAFLNYKFEKLQPCESLSYRFDNLSTGPAYKPFGPNSFIWDFGDGTRLVAGTGSVTHSYAAPGTYKVRLILPDTNYCNTPDSLERDLRLSPLVKAQFQTPVSGCIPYTATFKNTSLAGQTFTWDFGDGTTSNEVEPSHLYAFPGSYVVKLKVIDPNTCNVTDSTEKTILVHATPTAGFSVSPLVPVENTPHTFSNNSSHDAIRFKWLFGDGDSLLTTSRAAVEHQYNSTGTFNACLIAYNQYNCPDTTCAQVQTLVVPQLDVPNAFTPLGPAAASKVLVRGFAIGRMRFVIYNRLGQKVFESTDKNQGWDGRFKGVVQPMDVYAYTLEVEFTDGTRTTRKGDITLIR
jgi:gliding motility-associated-like protein